MNAIAQALLCLVYVGVLLYISWTDLRTYRIPNKVIGPAIVVALLAMPWTIGVANALLGALVAALPLIVARVIAGATKMGMGDVKLAIFVGLILGSDFAIVSLLIGLVLALVFGVIGVTRGTRSWHTKQPFGPFFTAGTLPLLLVLYFVV